MRTWAGVYRVEGSVASETRTYVIRFHGIDSALCDRSRLAS